MAQQGGVPRDADSFYVQDCRQVQENTHAIQNLTGQISRLVGTLEVEKDFQRCRQMVQEAVEKATETRQVLRRIQEHQSQAQNAAERNNRRMTYQKLSDNLAITARVLEDVVRRFTAEEQNRRMSTPRDATASVEADLSSGSAAGVAGGDDQPLVRAQSGSGESRFNSSCGRQSAEDVNSLQRIYTDLANTAEEQQPTFETLENHLVDMASDIERGRGEELPPTWGKYAANTEAARRRRLIMMAGGAFSLFGLVWFAA